MHHTESTLHSYEPPPMSPAAGNAPPFPIGSMVLHPVHGLLTVVAITRRAPVSLCEPDPLGAVGVVMVTRDRAPKEIFLDDATGEVGLRPLDLVLCGEDFYLLEAPAVGVYLRVMDALAWGCRGYLR